MIVVRLEVKNRRDSEDRPLGAAESLRVEKTKVITEFLKFRDAVVCINRLVENYGNDHLLIFLYLLSLIVMCIN